MEGTGPSPWCRPRGPDVDELRLPRTLRQDCTHAQAVNGVKKEVVESILDIVFGEADGPTARAGMSHLVEDSR